MNYIRLESLQYILLIVVTYLSNLHTGMVLSSFISMVLNPSMINFIWTLISSDWYLFGFKHLLWDLFVIGITVALSNKKKLNIGIIAIEYAMTNDTGEINNKYITFVRDKYKNILSLMEPYLKPLDSFLTHIIFDNLKALTTSEWFNYIVYRCILKYKKKTEYSLDITVLIKKFGIGYVHSEHTIKREDIMDKHKIDLKKSKSHYDLTNQTIDDDEVRKFQQLLMSGISNMEKNIDRNGLDTVDMDKIEQNMLSSLEEISKAFRPPDKSQLTNDNIIDFDADDSDEFDIKDES